MEENVKRYILESFREKYHRAGKLGKGQLLEEVQKLLGCHRKHAIRAMRRRSPGRWIGRSINSGVISVN
jgi:hypothetical protein